MDKTLEIELTEIRPKVLATALKFFRASRLDGDPEDVVQDVLLRFGWQDVTVCRFAVLRPGLFLLPRTVAFHFGARKAP